MSNRKPQTKVLMPIRAASDVATRAILPEIAHPLMPTQQNSSTKRASIAARKVIYPKAAQRRRMKAEPVSVPNQERTINVSIAVNTAIGPMNAQQMRSNATTVAKKVTFPKSAPTRKSITTQRNVSTAARWDTFPVTAQITKMARSPRDQRQNAITAAKLVIYQKLARTMVPAMSVPNVVTTETSETGET
jgi:hypothetical protein